MGTGNRTSTACRVEECAMATIELPSTSRLAASGGCKRWLQAMRLHQQDSCARVPTRASRARIRASPATKADFPVGNGQPLSASLRMGWASLNGSAAKRRLRFKRAHGNSTHRCGSAGAGAASGRTPVRWPASGRCAAACASVPAKHSNVCCQATFWRGSAVLRSNPRRCWTRESC